MEIVQVTLLGGALALDGTSVGQFMVSRPLIAGVLAGWVVGDPATGLVVGAVLELYLLVSFPTGGARFPEGATATVVAVSSAAAAGGAGALPIAVAMGLVWGQLGGASITALRHVNSILVPEPTEVRADPTRLVRAHVGAIGIDFVRGALVTLTGVLAGRLVLASVAAAWPLSEGASLGLVIVGGGASAGILLRDLRGVGRRRLLFAAGIALGALGARVL